MSTTSSPLFEATKRLGGALGKQALSKAGDKIGDVTEGLTSFASGDGGGGVQGLMDAVGIGGGGKGKGKGGKSQKIKLTTIVETADVGVPVDVAYDQWTQFTEFPSFMKKVEHVEQDEDDKLTWQAQIFWSHRNWESTIVEQTPDERIVWESSGAKGYVDGAVSFHEIGPSLTRIVLVLEYHPKGLFEHVGNIWRAQGRRARLELKHFQRHVMVNTVLHVDELEGWRGEIHDGEVIPPEEREDDQAEDQEGEDEAAESEDLDEDTEPEAEDEELDEDAEDAEEDEYEEPEEPEEPEEEPEPEMPRQRGRRKAAASRSRS
ncbi:SRPBCC family protein [Actinospica sp. MGRD01-02]|uniref:SRPBCC family protein n=1 Tax=Actinospica acidithermotolerans TaxID=2828514 RepID=A0A941EF17_9ACTN|nr:SRPBCC family protein [Actinospica acidithermotolerans]MBR7830266.1 SRPBCC family protein [Actinospica acidithermotolerans]